MTALPPEACRPRNVVVRCSDSLSRMLAATYADWDKPSQARAVHDELVARDSTLIKGRRMPRSASSVDKLLWISPVTPTAFVSA